MTHARAAARPVDLVDHHDGLEPEGQRLAGDEARLRHRTLDRIHQQQHPVDHRQHALDLAAEVGVPGGVDDVDARAAVLDGAVLGEDGDATLALDVVRIHDALAHALMRGEGAGLLEQAVHEGRLAVVDVRDDGDVADRAVHVWFVAVAGRRRRDAAAVQKRVRRVADPLLLRCALRLMPVGYGS